MAYLWIKWAHLLSVILAMGWMMMMALVLYAHNRAAYPQQARLERLFLQVGYGVMMIMVISGVALASENFSIMHSDWFYLKLFILAPLLAQFFHFRGVVREYRIVHLGYSQRYFLRHLVITLLIVSFILFLSLFKPL